MTSARPTRAAPRSATESPWFSLVWYAVLLAVVFTTAFWIGRVAGPDGGTPVEETPGHTPHAAASR
jgi:hypothetical protein